MLVLCCVISPEFDVRVASTHAVAIKNKPNLLPTVGLLFPLSSEWEAPFF